MAKVSCDKCPKRAIVVITYYKNEQVYHKLACKDCMCGVINTVRHALINVRLV